jgi:hypothetical protein
MVFFFRQNLQSDDVTGLAGFQQIADEFPEAFPMSTYPAFPSIQNTWPRHARGG